MNAVFADSFYFLARLNPADQWHERSARYQLAPDFKLVTTIWILVEVADALSGEATRQKAGEFVRALHTAEGLEVISADSDWFARGLNLYLKRPDKQWSLTDCISFVVMQDRGITDALTGDHHFEQAGFKALLKA
jgi:uncharacterized protein